MTESIVTKKSANNKPNTSRKQKKNKVRAPKGGYSFPEKQKYREDVWSFFRDNLNDDAKILFFPSKEGWEIPIALSMGFTQENLIAIDSSPADIAVSLWRKEYPNVSFYGGKLSNVIKRIHKDGIKIDAANLDFCNNLSAELFEEFNSFVGSDVLSDRCIISYTVMNGRESKSTNAIADLFISNLGIYEFFYRFREKKQFGFKNKRLMVVALNALSKAINKGSYLKFVDENSYMSGNIRMSYGFVDIKTESLILSEVIEYSESTAAHKERYMENIYKKIMCAERSYSNQMNKDVASEIVLFREIVKECIWEYETRYSVRMFQNKINGEYGSDVKRKTSNEFEKIRGNHHRCSAFIDKCYKMTSEKKLSEIKKVVLKTGCYNFDLK